MLRSPIIVASHVDAAIVAWRQRGTRIGAPNTSKPLVSIRWRRSR